MSGKLEPPTPSPDDKAIAGARAMVKGAVGAVPFIGAFLAEIIDLLYKQPIDKRREEWLREVANALAEVQKRQSELTPEKLAQNDQFVTVLHRATEVALRTHEHEKRRALRNAIVSAALPTAPDVDKQAFFLRLVDELTLNQVLVLALYADPREWFARRGRQLGNHYAASRMTVLREAYPEIASHPYAKELILGPLRDRGLLGGYDGMVSGGSVYDRITSPLGHEFLQYVQMEDGTVAVPPPA